MATTSPHQFNSVPTIQTSLNLSQPNQTEPTVKGDKMTFSNKIFLFLGSTSPTESLTVTTAKVSVPMPNPITITYHNHYLQTKAMKN